MLSLQEPILLSTDIDDKGCQYCDLLQEFNDDELPMTSAEGSATTSDLDFHTSNADNDLGSTSGASFWSDPEIQEELSGTSAANKVGDSDSNVEIRENRSRITTRSRQSLLYDTLTPRIATMVSTSKEKDLPEPRLEKHQKFVSTTMQTRTASKLAFTKTRVEGDKSIGIMDGSVSRKKGKFQCVAAANRKKKGTTVSPAVVDIVFEKLKNSAPDAEEMRRKMEEDAARCGRTVRSVEKDSTGIACFKSVADTSSQNVRRKETTTTQASQSVACQRSMTPRPLSTSADNHEEGKNIAVEPPVEGLDGNERALHDGVTNKRMHSNLSIQQPTSKAWRATGFQNTHLHSSPLGEVDVRALNGGMQRSMEAEWTKRIPSPDMYYRDKLSRRKESGRSISPAQRQEVYRELSFCSMPASPKNNEYQRRARVESRNPRQSRSRSPAFCKEIREQVQAEDKEEMYYNTENNDWGYHGDRTMRTEYVVGREEQRKWRSDSSGSRFGPQSSAPLSRGRGDWEGSQRIYKSRMPSNSMPKQAQEIFNNNDRGMQRVKEEDLAFISPAMDRRSRRYKQAVLEAEKLRRGKEGKKAFYLTLDNEGKPCGPGKKAWLADINKLATWLDPSCMHIRKQSYDDMCIFKNRLNENFKYSGDLNEDYLRSLAGKAVTRKRTQLIALIQRDGSRPSNVDAEIWERLEKIANSKQRDDRTEHGRYANACRKTLGRTGSLGVHGVRERLRELYGRSPDPHELKEEMERYKGFGRDEEGRHRVLSRHIEERIHDISDEECTQRQRHSLGSENLEIEGHYGKPNLVRRAGMEGHVSPSRVHWNRMDIVAAGSAMEKKMDGFLERRKTSEDEYIARLEAELFSYRGQTSQGSGCCEVSRWHRGGRREVESDGFQTGGPSKSLSHSMASERL